MNCEMQVNSSPKNGILCKVLEILPPSVARAIEDELAKISGGGGTLFEIRLRKNAKSSLVFTKERRALGVRLYEEDMNFVLRALTGGALYAHRDTLLDGYIAVTEGLRVGVCGKLKYDGGVPVGISDISAFIFRISHFGCAFADELYAAWRARGSSGLLIYSPPIGGKTTAIRALAGLIGKTGKHVVAVDERCEFIPSEYDDCEVDILRGFKKSKGIEIAVRTLGAQLVIVDEIGPEEADGVLSALTLGVPLIATVHARSADEILHKPAFAPFIKAGVFETLAGIKRLGEDWRISVNSIPNIATRVEFSKAGGVL